MTNGCVCKDWLENIEILDTAMTLYLIRNSKMLKKSFIFCPYCSKNLVEINKPKDL